MSKLCFLLFSACLVFGQATQKSVTITAFQGTSVAPDQIVFGVTVDSSLNTGLDDVIAALRGSGISAADLSSIYTQTAYTSQNQEQEYLEWNFVLPVFFGAMQDTVASLTNIQKAIAQQKTGLVLSFSPQGTRVSPQTQQAHQCSTASLIADAQAQAQRLADAAGYVLGPVLAASDAGPTAAPIQVFALSIAAAPSFQFYSPPVPSTCALTVKFALFGG